MAILKGILSSSIQYKKVKQLVGSRLLFICILVGSEGRTPDMSDSSLVTGNILLVPHYKQFRYFTNGISHETLNIFILTCLFSFDCIRLLDFL